MSDDFPSKADVVSATAADLAVILDWLEREYEKDGEGFWCNRNIIERACADGELYVIRENGNAVAYQVGHYAADIANVRQDLKRRGFGTALFEASLDRAYRDDINVMSGEAMPTSSLPFWERLGFQRYPERYRPSTITIRRYIERDFVVPDGPDIEVEISFYPEAAKYGQDVQPLATHNVRGVARDDGVIQLERRVIIATSEEPEGKDIVVRIKVGGGERCFDKAKYEVPEALGVINDGRGAFYIDQILPG